jgi:hypothetical protein
MPPGSAGPAAKNEKTAGPPTDAVAADTEADIAEEYREYLKTAGEGA